MCTFAFDILLIHRATLVVDHTASYTRSTPARYLAVLPRPARALGAACSCTRSPPRSTRRRVTLSAYDGTAPRITLAVLAALAARSHATRSISRHRRPLPCSVRKWAAHLAELTRARCAFSREAIATAHLSTPRHAPGSICVSLVPPHRRTTSPSSAQRPVSCEALPSDCLRGVRALGAHSRQSAQRARAHTITSASAPLPTTCPPDICSSPTRARTSRSARRPRERTRNAHTLTHADDAIGRRCRRVSIKPPHEGEARLRRLSPHALPPARAHSIPCSPSAHILHWAHARRTSQPTYHSSPRRPPSQ